MYSDVGNTFASDMIPFRLLVMLIDSSCWEIMPGHLRNLCSFAFVTQLFDALEYTRNSLSLVTFLVDLVPRLEIKSLREILLIYLYVIFHYSILGIIL